MTVPGVSPFDKDSPPSFPCTPLLPLKPHLQLWSLCTLGVPLEEEEEVCKQEHGQDE